MDYRYIRWDVLHVKTNPALFRSFDGHPIEFYFHIDYSQVKEKFEQLVKAYGGKYVREFINMTPTTVLIVDDKSARSFFSRVSFKASYVMDCVIDNSLQDINDYIHSDPIIFKVYDYMNIIYYRQLTFVDENVRTKKGNRETCLNPCSHCALDPFACESMKVHSSPFSTKEIHCSTCTCKKIPEKSSNINTSDKRLLESNHTNNKNKAKSLQSSSYSLFSKSKNVRDRCSEIENSPPKNNIVSDSDESNNDCEIFTDDGNLQEEKESSPPFQKAQSDDSEDEDFGPPSPVPAKKGLIDKHSRLLYTRHEKEEILKFIIRKNAYDLLGGTSIWQKMERSNVCPRRTWMSLQNHFKRTLVKELEKFAFLSKQQIKALRK